MKFLNTTEAAELLGISVRRVQALIKEGKIRAERMGRDWLISRSAIARVRTYGKAGRPPKEPPGVVQKKRKGR